MHFGGGTRCDRSWRSALTVPRVTSKTANTAPNGSTVRTPVTAATAGKPTPSTCPSNGLLRHNGYGADEVQRLRLPALIEGDTRGMYDLLVDGARTGREPWARLHAGGKPSIGAVLSTTSISTPSPEPSRPEHAESRRTET